MKFGKWISGAEEGLKTHRSALGTRLFATSNQTVKLQYGKPSTAQSDNPNEPIAQPILAVTTASGQGQSPARGFRSRANDRFAQPRSLTASIARDSDRISRPMGRPGYPDVDRNLGCRCASHMQYSAPRSSSLQLQFTSGAPLVPVVPLICLVQATSLSGGGAKRAHGP